MLEKRPKDWLLKANNRLPDGWLIYAFIAVCILGILNAIL